MASSFDAPDKSGRKARVFLSYSRADSEFTRRLADALAARGYVPDFDQSHHDPANIDTGISAEDEWWKRLQEMIAAAPAVVFIISPESAASRVCDEEIAYARALGKRVIAIVRRSIDPASAPPRLSALNWKLSFADDQAFDSSLDALCAALDLDVEWHRESARLTALAVKWDQDGRPEAQLLTSGAVSAADAQATRRPAGAPEAGDLLVRFLEVSRSKAAADRERLLTITGRAFVKPAEQAAAEERYDAALRLAAAGTLLGEDLEMRLVPERVPSALAGAECQALRCVLRGHEGTVQDASFSPDGTRIVSASRGDRTVRVFDVVSGRDLFVLQGHESGVTSATFNADGTRLLTTSGDNTARVWDAASRREIAVLRGHKDAVKGASFSPNGACIVTASQDGTARVWDTESGGEIGVLRGHDGAISKASFSFDATRVLTASSDTTARVWDVTSGREVAVLRGRGREVQRASFSQDATRIVTVYGQGFGAADQARLWDAASGREIAALAENKEEVRDASFSSDGSRIVTASQDGGARVWNSEGRLMAVLSGHEGGLRVASFSLDGALIITASEDRTARGWDAATGHERFVLRGHEDWVWGAAFSPDNQRVLTVSRDKTVRVWDAAHTREIAELSGHKGRSWHASFDADGTRIVTAGVDDKTARVWNSANGREIVVLRGHEGAVENTSFSPEGTRVVTASRDRTARVWDSAGGREVATLRGHEDSVQSASFSPDGARIVTASLDKTARVWDAANGREIGALLKHHAPLMDASYSPDGTRIVTATQDKTARIWDAANESEIGALGGHEQWVRSASFSPDGARIVTTDGRAARVWDVASLREILVLRTPAVSASFSPDGTRIVTASGASGVVHAMNGIVRVWDAASGREIAREQVQGDAVKSAAFSSDGAYLVVSFQNHSPRVFDVSRTAALTGDPAEVLAASLANGRGVKTESECADLLMQAAPNDLYGALLSRLSVEKREVVARRAEILARALHPKCYLPSSSTPGDIAHAEDGSATATHDSIAYVGAVTRESEVPPPLVEVVTSRPGANAIPRTRSPIRATIVVFTVLAIGAGAVLLAAWYGLMPFR